jgi:alpha-glucosidase
MNVPGIGVGRDGCRTPMQWTAKAHAGFTNGEPWLPLALDYVSENVETLSADGQSILHLYQTLILLRKVTPQLVSGAYVPIIAIGDILAYKREHEGTALLIILNLGADPISITPDAVDYTGEILVSTNLDRSGEMIGNGFDLRGDEGLIIRLS